MKPNSRPVILISILIMSCCILPRLAMAQFDETFTDPDLPIDGGVSLLVAAGVAYGIKKIRDERKKKLDKLP